MAYAPKQLKGSLGPSDFVPKAHIERMNMKTPGAIEVGEQLIEIAKAAALKSYAPYSKFRVGAAVLGDDGAIYAGCNVENVSYGLSICAERSAIFAAVSAGCRRISAVAVVCIDADPTAAHSKMLPCGACRQVMAEFAVEMTIYMADGARYSLSELLPAPFRLG
jgi:cytidine deaminase